MIEFAYGLDFGTSKTSLSFARCGGSRPPVTDIHLTDRGDSRTSTCVLYDSENTMRGVGSPAEEHYRTFLSEEERAAHRFAANFKPHVHTDPEAERVALDFLRAIRKSEDVKRELDPPAARVTIVGMPAGWGDAAEAKLLELVGGAGFPAPRALPEPVGALFHFLGARLRAEDLEKDILVIDWGAGTCDFSLMHRGQPSEEDSWGSNLYGGRLFDDLFFQWFVEQAREDADHRDALEEVLATPALEGTLREFRARELKEEFSLRSRKPQGSFRSRLVEIGERELGRLRVSDLKEFEERARRYVPSPAMRRRLLDLEGDTLPGDRRWLEAMLAGESVDLLEWGASLVSEGGGGPVRPSDVEVVVLAGGSTLWPWFQQLVERPGTYAASVQVYNDRQPELTIARGLASAFAIGTHARELAARTEQHKSAIVSELRSGFLEPRMERLSSVIAERFLQENYAEGVRPVLERFDRREIQREEAEARLRNTLTAWLAQGGREVISTAVGEVNAASPSAIQRVAAGHDVRIEELLKLAIDVCAPFASEDWSAWLADAEFTRRLIDALRDSALEDFLNVLGALLALPFQIIEAARNWLLGAFQSDEKRTRREREQEQAQRERDRQRAEREYERVRERFQQALEKRFREHPTLDAWAAQMQLFLRQRLETVAKLAAT